MKRLLRIFKKIYIEITSVCNLACSFCPPTERKASFNKPEDFASRLDRIKPYTDYIYLHVKGDPLLHPRIDELLDISHQKGFKVNITTNGTLIRKNRDKLLGKPALRQMNFRPTDTRCIIPHIEKLAASSIPMPKTVIADARCSSEENDLYAVEDAIRLSHSECQLHERKDPRLQEGHPACSELDVRRTGGSLRMPQWPICLF